MPQIQLPVFPAGCTEINAHLALERRDNQITYFNGQLPVFTHAVQDVASFRFFTSQLILNGTASQAEIVAAFGVPLTTVKRYCCKAREEGAKGFFGPAPRRRGSQLTPERLVQAQQGLDAGLGVPALSRQLGVLATTLHKALRSGRLAAPKKKPRSSPPSGPARSPSG